MSKEKSAKSGNKEKKVNPNERAIFDGPVKAQRGDIFKVTSKGVVVEYSENMLSAMSAYKEAGKPKTMLKVFRGSGIAEKLYEEII